MNKESSSARYQCPDCGARRGVSINQDGWAYCFACPEDQHKKGKLDPETLVKSAGGAASEAGIDFGNIFGNAKPASITDRRINQDTCEFYGVKSIDGILLFPYGDKAAKLRLPDKDYIITGKEHFKKAGLFGQELFSKGGKYVTITEGELDALAAFQMSGSQWPVVSLKNGAESAVKGCKEAYEWLDSFDKIVLCFDNDKPGKDAAKAVSEIFPEKALIFKHEQGYNDACDYLRENKGTRYQKLFWRSEEHVPDEIVLSSELFDEVMKPLEMPFCNYPWDMLNLMLYGMRKGEILTVMAGSGVGKSTFVKELLKQVYNKTTSRIGVMSLEETMAVAAMGMMSLHAQHRFHLPTKDQMRSILNDPLRLVEKPFLDDVTEEDRYQQKFEAFDAVLNEDRFAFLEHKGHITIDSVIGHMRYLTKAQDCDVILLDHISILVGLVAGKKTSEREAIDEVMHHLRKLVEETGVMLINICHLRKPSDGKGHEEGRRVQSIEARGSGAIVQLSNIAVALEGNRQAEDPEERNKTTVRILKNRFSGETGEAGQLQYNEITGRLDECDNKDLENAL
jgi:twinkle protein